ACESHFSLLYTGITTETRGEATCDSLMRSSRSDPMAGETNNASQGGMLSDRPPVQDQLPSRVRCNFSSQANACPTISSRLSILGRHPRTAWARSDDAMTTDGRTEG